MRVPWRWRIRWLYDRWLARLRGGPHDEPRGEDAVLGLCRYNGIDAYDCSRRIATPHAAETELATHLWLHGEQPTASQRAAVQMLVERYDQWWPPIAARLCEMHPELDSIEQVTRHVAPRVAVHVGEHEENSLELVYSFDLPGEGFRGYFLRLEEGRILEAFLAE